MSSTTINCRQPQATRSQIEPSKIAGSSRWHDKRSYLAFGWPFRPSRWQLMEDGVGQLLSLVVKPHAWSTIIRIVVRLAGWLAGGWRSNFISVLMSDVIAGQLELLLDVDGRWLSGRQAVAIRPCHCWSFDGHGWRAWAVSQGVTEEFCVKVLKFEIVNSRKLFNYFSRVVPRTIESAHQVLLFPGRFKNGPFKNR